MAALVILPSGHPLEDAPLMLYCVRYLSTNHAKDGRWCRSHVQASSGNHRVASCGVLHLPPTAEGL